MKSRRRPFNDSIDKLVLNEIVATNTNAAWIEDALREEAAHLRDIALSVTDAAVSTVSQVFELHGLLVGVFDHDDNKALYRVITEIAARLIRERLISPLGDGRRDPGTGKEIAISVVLREGRGQ